MGGSGSAVHTVHIDHVYIRWRARGVLHRGLPMAPTDAGGNDRRPSPDLSSVDFAQYRARRLRARLLDLLDRLVAAMERRDVQAV